MNRRLPGVYAHTYGSVCVSVFIRLSFALKISHVVLRKVFFLHFLSSLALIKKCRNRTDKDTNDCLWHSWNTLRSKSNATMEGAPNDSTCSLCHSVPYWNDQTAAAAAAAPTLCRDAFAIVYKSVELFESLTIWFVSRYSQVTRSPRFQFIFVYSKYNRQIT